LQRWFSLFFLLLLMACGGHEVDFARSLAVRTPADLILRNGKVITVDREFSIKQAVAIRDGRFVAVGGESDVRPLIGPATRVVDLEGRAVIPGLIDAHIHATVAGLSWDADLHWQMTRTLADGLRQIAAAAKSRPAGSWIVVGGGWVPTQFSERQFPTRADLDAIAPNHPVYIQYLRLGALLNSAALKAIGVTAATPDPVGGKFERNPTSGELTGWLQGSPAWEYAYKKIPALSLDRIRQSLRSCFRELNRLGVTSVGDMHSEEVTFAHRRLLADMARTGDLTLRINFYVSPDGGGDELEQIELAAGEVKHLPQSDLLRFNGFGPTLIRGLGEGDDPADPKGDALSVEAKDKFRRLARFFATEGHNIYLNAGRDATARQLLDVLEEIHAATPFKSQRIGFAQLADATAESIARIKNLGGGIAVLSSMALTGERNVELWGLEKARNAPPLRTMIESGISLGAGTDAFRLGNYSPMLSLWWLVTGKTVAGSSLRSPSQNVTRAEALRLYTTGNAWFTFDERRKGSIELEKLADLVVLNADYLTVPEEQLRSLESLLTIVGGKIVYAAGPFAKLER
jgi:predicted amidohydrolase YtcJ